MLDWVSGFIEQTGYLGIFLLMLAENLFPPIPSELIMPLSGFTAATGGRNIVLVIIAGAAGSLAGAVFWYAVGAWTGVPRLKRWAERYGHWLTMTPEDVDKACAWFDRHGGKAVFFGRLVPTVRTLISVPAGIADMALPRFLALSSLGTVVWTAPLAVAGYHLGDRYAEVERWMSPASNIVLAALVLWYVYRVITFRKAAPRAR